MHGLAATYCRGDRGGNRRNSGLPLVYHEGVAAGGCKGVIIVWLRGHVCALDVVALPGRASRASLRKYKQGQCLSTSLTTTKTLKARMESQFTMTPSPVSHHAIDASLITSHSPKPQGEHQGGKGAVKCDIAVEEVSSIIAIEMVICWRMYLPALMVHSNVMCLNQTKSAMSFEM